MTTILETLITNAFTVIPLGFVVWMICRRLKRPAIAHGLWVLLLVKLLVPSFFQIPLPFATTIPQAVSSLFDHKTIGTVVVDSASTNDTHARNAAAAENEIGAANAVPADAHIANISWNEMGWSVESAVRVLLMLWLSGSIVYLARMIYRQIRFTLYLRANEEIDVDLIGEGYNLAWQMGLQNPPRVRILRGTLSPMLCGFGRGVTLIIPAELSDRLSTESRATLIVHELAHFHRRDHWVRLLEGVVTGIFWWHPAVYFIRKQIEAVEEECVDARVVSEFPERPRQYAEALLDTLDFLCERRVVLPPMASGLGTAPLLRRRLKQIMAHETSAGRPIGRRGVCCIALLGAMLLPMQCIQFATASSADTTDSGQPDQIAVTEPVERFPVDESSLCVIAPSEKFRLIKNGDGRCQIQNLLTDRAINLPPLTINCATFIRGDRLVIGTEAGELRVINCLTGELATAYQFPDPVASLDWTETERAIVVGVQGTLLVLRDSDLRTIARRRFPDQIMSARFSRKGETIVVVTHDPDEIVSSTLDEAVGSLLLINTSDLYTIDLFEFCRHTTMARFDRQTHEVITYEPSGRVTTMTPGPLTAVATHWLPEKAISAIEFSSQVDDARFTPESF